MTPRQQEAVDALRQHGSISAAASALNITRSSLRCRLKAAGLSDEDIQGMLRGVAATVGAHRRGIDPAIAEGMRKLGTQIVPGVGWIKTKPTDDQPGYSFMVKPQEQTPEEIAATIRAAFEQMEPAEPVVAPEQVHADACALIPLMDVHLGMLAWGKETGAEDYDVNLALSDMRHAFAKVLARTPPAARGVLLIGGDFFHADDNRAETPQSRHRLDVDGRFLRVVRAGIAIIAETIERMLSQFGELVVRVLRGNHDPHAHVMLTVALIERYRNEPRVTIDDDARDLFMMQWGRSAIFGHHGDRGKPDQMLRYLCDVAPFWSETRHRYLLTGHVHHDAAKDFGPLRWESLRAFCPPDAYAAGMGYGARRALQALTFDKRDGLVLRAIDPIERGA